MCPHAPQPEVSIRICHRSQRCGGRGDEPGILPRRSVPCTTPDQREKKPRNVKKMLRFTNNKYIRFIMGAASHRSSRSPRSTPSGSSNSAGVAHAGGRGGQTQHITASPNHLANHTLRPSEPQAAPRQFTLTRSLLHGRGVGTYARLRQSQTVPTTTTVYWKVALSFTNFA